MLWDNKNILEVLKKNGVVVMLTDTLYGIVGRAQNVSTVERIYAIRKRNPEKPCIILIGDIGELEKFSIYLLKEEKEILEQYWLSGFEPVSIVLDCPNEKFAYLHRGTKTLAFRLPAQKDLQNLLKETGPLIAPSANTEALPPSQNISQAKNYFGDGVVPVRSRTRKARASVTFGRPASNGVNLYIDGGEVKGKASKVIRLHKDGSVEVLRF